MEDKLNEFVEVQETEDFGKAVVAKCDLVPGSLGLGFREKPLIVFPPCADGVVPPWGPSAQYMGSKSCPLTRQHWMDYLHFLKQEVDVQTKVLSFYAEFDCLDPRIVYAFVAPYLDSPDSAKIFTCLFLVVTFNSCTLQGPNADGSWPDFVAHGMFEVASRMAHSCRPNCVWFATQEGLQRTVRVIQPVKKGEVLTISYIPEKYLCKPTHVRQDMLLQNQNFLCKCKRCKAIADDSRRFGCHNKSCCGHHMVKQVEDDDLPDFLVCTVCGEAAPDDFELQMCDSEMEATRATIGKIDSITDEGLPIDVRRKLLSLKPPHPSHALGLQIYRGHSDYYNSIQNWPKAISAQRQWINCRLQIHGKDYLDQYSGFGYERLGDMLVNVGDWRGAQEAYRHAVRAFQIARGGSSEPYTRCAMDKLITVQKKLPTNKSETSCGLCGVVSTKKCGQCGLAVYCNRDHQIVHWKVHKLSCGKSV